MKETRTGTAKSFMWNIPVQETVGWRNHESLSTPTEKTKKKIGGGRKIRKSPSDPCPRGWGEDADRLGPNGEDSI